MEQTVPSITTNDLEWCANWTQDNKFYCTLFIKGNKYSKPRGFNKLLEDPNIYRKFNIQKGIGAPDLIKNMQADVAKNRTMMVEEILGAA